MVIESRWADFMQHYYLVCMCVQHICIKLLPYLVANILRYNSFKNEENWQSYCKNNRVIFFYTNITVAKTLQGRQLDKTCSVGYCISCCKIWCIHLQKAMRISWHEQTEKAFFLDAVLLHVVDVGGIGNKAWSVCQEAVISFSFCQTGLCELIQYSWLPVYSRVLVISKTNNSDVQYS